MAKRASKANSGSAAETQEAPTTGETQATKEAQRTPLLGVDVKGELRDIELAKVVDPDGPSDRLPRPGDGAAIEQLARSMRECGQLQPVMVEVVNPGRAESYRRVFGRRRIAAARSLGWTTIRASVVAELAPDVRRTIVAIENVQRQDLTPAEETLAVDELLKLQAYTAAKRVRATMTVGPDLGRVVDDDVIARCEASGGGNPLRHREILLQDAKVRLEATEQVAAMLGKPASWVRDRMYIGRLSEHARGLVLSGKLPLAHAREIAKVGDEAKRDRLARAFAAGGPESISDVEAGQLADLQMEVRRSVFALCEAPWKLSLPFAQTPACDGCPHNSANNPGLFEHGGTASKTMVGGKGTYDSIEADHFRAVKAGICTLPGCYEQKLRAAKAAITAAARRIVDDKKKPSEAKVPAYVDDAALTRKVNERRKLVGRGGYKPSSGGSRSKHDDFQEKWRIDQAYCTACEHVNDKICTEVQKLLKPHPLRNAVMALWDEYASKLPQKGPPVAAFLKQVAGADEETCRKLILQDIEARKLRYRASAYSTMDLEQADALAVAFGLERPVYPKKAEFTAKYKEEAAAKKKANQKTAKKGAKKPAAAVKREETVEDLDELEGGDE